MGRGIQAALAALGARGTGANWSLDLATLDLSSVFGGALAGEAVVDVTSEEALAFRQPAELAALGSLWVPGLESAEALAVAICEAHESLRARLDNDLETLARLGIDARLANPVAHARGTLQIGDDDVAVEIDDAGELVVTHIGTARVQVGQGRALGAPEDTEAEEALVRITRVVQRVRERGLLEGAPADDDQGIDVDVDLDDGETAAPAGSDWVEDEHTQSAGESSRRAETKHLSDEQLAAVHEALSEESDSDDPVDMSDEALPIEDPVETAPLSIRSTTVGLPELPHPMVAEDEDDIRTVSISIRQQSSLLRALDALGKQPGDRASPGDAPVDEGAAASGIPTDGAASDGEEGYEDADRTVTLAASAPPVSVASMPDLPEGSDDREAQPTVVLPPPLRHSAETGGAMPAPTAAVEPVNARIPSDEIESIARGFDEGDDIDDEADAIAPAALPDDAGDDTAGYQFGRPPIVPTLDDAPPATNATVSQPAEPAAPGPSMEEPSADEPGVDAESAAAVALDAPPADGVVDSLALLPPDDQPPAARDFRAEANGFDDHADVAAAQSEAVEVAGQEGTPPGLAFEEAGEGAMEPSETAAINVPDSLPGTVDAGPPVRVGAAAAPLPIIEDDDDDPFDQPKTRPFRPSDLFGLLKRTTDQDDPAADPDALEARADALEAEAQELRERAGSLRARRAAVTVVPNAPLSSVRSETSTAPALPTPPPPPVMGADASSSSSSLPSLPSVEVQAIDVLSEEERDSFAVAAPAPRPRNSAEEGVSLADVRAALGPVPDDSTHVGVVEAPVELRAPFPSAESDVFADADADQQPSIDGEEQPELRRSIVLVVEDARARDRLKRHLSPRFDELFEAADATSAVELPNLARLAALVFVRPRPDEKTRFGLEHLETMARRPRVLVISSDNAFDQMPSVDHRLPLGQRASEVAQQVIDGLTALGVPLHDV